MKTSVRIFTLTATVLLSLDVSAQNMVKTNISGIYLEQAYSKSQIETLWGQPISFKESFEEPGYCMTYVYSQKTTFCFLKDDNTGKFNLMFLSIDDSKFKINGVVGIGDNVSKIDLLPNAKKKISDLDGVTYIYSVSNEPDMLFAASIDIYTRNSVIYRIMCSIF